MAVEAALGNAKVFVVEHLDPELEYWSSLEYRTIAAECAAGEALFVLSSVPSSLALPDDLASTPNLAIEQQSVEDLFSELKNRVCLLDPSAADELCPEDGDRFNVFLFGGILGMG